MRYILILFLLGIIGLKAYSQLGPQGPHPEGFDLLSQQGLYNSGIGEYQLSGFWGGGLSTLKYSPSVGVQNNGTGFSGGFDFIYYWSPEWGVSGGIAIDNFGSSFQINQSETTTPSVDGDTDNDGIPDEFILISRFESFTEKQRSFTFSIPVMAKFRHSFDFRWGIMAGAGTKFSFPLSEKAEITDGSITTSGYYPQYGDNTVLPVGPGFGKFKLREQKDTKTGFGVSLINEVTAYYKLNSAFWLYGGPYFEYQLNRNQKDNQKPLVEYEVKSENQADIVYNPVIASSESKNVNRIAFGIKVGLVFDFGGNKKLQANKHYHQERKESIRKKRPILMDLLRQNVQTGEELVEAFYQPGLRLYLIPDISRRPDFEEMRRLCDLIFARDSAYEADNVDIIIDVRTQRLSAVDLRVLDLPVNFKFGSTKLTDLSRANARKIGDMLSKHPYLVITITGHTCDIGTKDSNYRLGLARAQSLANEFKEMGVLESQLDVRSKGELEPLYPNDSEQNRKRNRRVEIIIDDDSFDKEK